MGDFSTWDKMGRDYLKSIRGGRRPRLAWRAACKYLLGRRYRKFKQALAIVYHKGLDPVELVQSMYQGVDYREISVQSVDLARLYFHDPVFRRIVQAKEVSASCANTRLIH